LQKIDVPVYARENIDYNEEMLEKAAPGMRRVGLVIDGASKGIVMDEDEIKEARRTGIHGPVIIDPNDTGPPPDKFPQRGRLPDTRKYYPSSSESSGGEEDDGTNDSAAKPADSGTAQPGAPIKPLGLVPTDNAEG
jgi:hypothetical protein